MQRHTYLISRRRLRERWNSTDEKRIIPSTNDWGSHESNEKFVLWENVQDILILQHFPSDIYACRLRFHYHKACLIFISCARGLPHYRWLSALDLVALSVSPSLSPAVPRTSGPTRTTETTKRECNREEKRGRSGGGTVQALRTWCQPERPTVPQSHLSSWGLWFAWLSPILRHTINTTLGRHLQF